jgi:hypothetical protein
LQLFTSFRVEVINTNPNPANRLGGFPPWIFVSGFSSTTTRQSELVYSTTIQTRTILNHGELRGHENGELLESLKIKGRADWLISKVFWKRQVMSTIIPPGVHYQRYNNMQYASACHSLETSPQRFKSLPRCFTAAAKAGVAGSRAESRSGSALPGTRKRTRR